MGKYRFITILDQYVAWLLGRVLFNSYN